MIGTRQFPNKTTRELVVIAFVLLLHVLVWFVLRAVNDSSAVHLLEKQQTQYVTLLSANHASRQTISASLITQSTQDQTSPQQPQKNKNITTAQKPKRTTSSNKASAIQTTSPVTATVPNSSTSHEVTVDSPSGSQGKETSTLDYSVIGKTVKEISAQHQKKKVLPGTTKQLTEAEKFEQAVGKSGRGDCKTEHSHLGILAIPMLIKDAVTDTGCKW